MYIRNTKEILTDSFLELAKKKRIDKITIREITQNCGMTSPTFYNHFKDKYDLMIWVYAKFVTKIHDEYMADDIKVMSWRNVLKKSLVFQWENREFMFSAIKYTSAQDSFSKLIAEHSIHDFLEMLEFRKNAVLTKEERFSAELYIYGMVKMDVDRILDKSTMALDEFCELCSAAVPDNLKKYLYPIL